MTPYLFDNNVSNSWTCEQCLLLLLLQSYYSPTQFNGIKYHMCYIHSLVIVYALDNLSCLKISSLMSLRFVCLILFKLFASFNFSITDFIFILFFLHCFIFSLALNFEIFLCFLTSSFFGGTFEPLMGP